MESAALPLIIFAKCELPAWAQGALCWPVAEFLISEGWIVDSFVRGGLGLLSQGYAGELQPAQRIRVKFWHRPTLTTPPIIKYDPMTVQKISFVITP